MAFNVGAIVSKLTLDKSGWNQSVKEVGEDQKKMQGMSDKTAKKFKQVGAAMTVAGGAIVGALAGMTKAFANTGDEIDKMSRRTGIGSVALSELKHAAELSGASLGDIEKGVKRMSGTILDAHAGLETYIRSFRQMGISIDDLMKMNPEQQFISISEAIAKIEDPTIRAALAQDVFGRAGTALLPMFDKGAEGLREMRERAHDLGIVFSEDAAKAAAELTDAQLELKMSLKGVGLTIIKDLAPHITEFIKKMTTTVEKVITWIKENPKLTFTIVKITAGIGALLLVLGPIVMLIPKLVIGVKMLAGGFTFLLSPVGLLVGALAALAIGYMSVKKAQDELEKSTARYDEVNEKLFKKLEKAAEQAGMTKEEFAKLREEYDDNSAALGMAIKKGKEGVEMQKALADVGKEHGAEIDKQREATDDLGFSMGDLTGRFQGYLDELKETKKETKTWVDYLKDVGVKTVKEKEDRVKELTGYLGDLKTAYDKGLLSLEDYINSTNKANKEIEELSETIIETVPLAGREFDLTFGEMTATTSDFVVETKKKVKENETVWGNMWKGITGTAKRALGDMLAGNSSFKDAVGLVWDDMKQRFSDIVADMVINFAIDGVKELIGGAKKAASGIGTAVESIGGATAPLAAGIGTLITTLAKAIASAAEIIAASAPAILIAAGVALAIYAGFKLLQSLFAKKAKPGSELDFLRQITENTFTIKDLMLGDYKTEIHTTQNILRDISGNTERMVKWQDVTVNMIRGLGGIIKESFKSLPSAQKGAVITQPTLAVLHGSPADPEIVSPVSKLVEGLKGFGGASANLSQNINVNIMVKDQLDPYVAEKITREQIVPNMLKAIDVDSRNKTRMRNILGIQV